MTSDYVSGDWNAICDICGLEYKASMLRLNWRSQRVCDKDFEGRHPQMFIRPRAEKISTDWARLPGATEVWTGADLLGPLVTTINPDAYASTHIVYVDGTGGAMTLGVSNPTNPTYTYSPMIYISRVDATANVVTVFGIPIAGHQTIIGTWTGVNWVLFGKVG